MEVIENFTADVMEGGKDNMVAHGNQLKTDKHKAYIKMKDNGKSIETGMSNEGMFLYKLHKEIKCFKNWFRGTHHGCSGVSSVNLSYRICIYV